MHSDSGGCDAAVHILLRLQLMPDKENWAWMVAVEIRRGDTGHGWLWWRFRVEHWERLVAVDARQGKLAWMFVVEARRGTLGIGVGG